MPFASFWLAEMGADVIKIERPGEGDVIRGWDNAVRGMSTGFVWVNAGKRDLTVDLRRPEGRQIVARLAQGADVFLENFAPGVADRLGLGHEELLNASPRLIYCSLSGYGQDGPYRDVKAYDLLIQGESGLLLTNGTPDEPAKIGVPITDLIGGATVAFGIACALVERHRTGRGCYVDVAMLDAIVPWLGYFPHHYWHGGGEPPRTGMQHQYLAPYGPFLAADGAYVNLVVASDAHWRLFAADVVERVEWLDDPAMSSIDARSSHREHVNRVVAEAIATRPSSEWFERLRAARLPFGAVRPIAEVVDHPQLAHREMWVEADSPVGAMKVGRLALSPAHHPRTIPGLGEHTDAILGEAGFSGAQIVELRATGVV